MAGSAHSASSGRRYWLAVMVIVLLIPIPIFWLLAGALDASSTAALLVSLGRLAGLIATGILAVLIVTSARIPWLEQLFGRGVLMGAHRVLGMTIGGFILVHIICFMVSRGVLNSETDVKVSAWTVLAFLGTVLIAGIVITSTKKNRRKFGYQRWHKFHLFSYVAAVFLFPHMIHDGRDLTNGLERTYWCLGFGLALVSPFIFKIALPKWRERKQVETTIYPSR